MMLISILFGTAIGTIGGIAVRALTTWSCPWNWSWPDLLLVTWCAFGGSCVGVAWQIFRRGRP